MVSSHPRPGRMLVAVTLATVAIFGALVLGITLKLRAQLRAETLQREADALHAVAHFLLGSTGDRLETFAPEFAIEDAFAAVLESSRLKDVLAVQLFDSAGALRHAQPLAPDDVEATRWWPAVLPEPRARFLPEQNLAVVSPLRALPASSGTVPLLDVVVPLQRGGSGPPLGVARYWIDGRPLDAKLARMDGRLALQGGVAFIGGATLLALVLAWAFRRLAEAHQRLAEQSADLARANEELDFAAKTGALGAISAHLIHGLKNPLAGLEGFVAESATAGGNRQLGEAWQAAMETTRRLRAMVSEVTGVLADESNGAGDYPVPVAEVVEAARVRAAPAAEQRNVILAVTTAGDAQVSARTASLSGLVLANLLANAIEACPPGARVETAARVQEGRVEFLVSDSGPGLPEAVRAALFRPVRSAKRGGGGVGLAISHRLARHAGGELELVRSDAVGTVFRLRVPALASSSSSVSENPAARPA